MKVDLRCTLIPSLNLLCHDHIEQSLSEQGVGFHSVASDDPAQGTKLHGFISRLLKVYPSYTTSPLHNRSDNLKALPGALREIKLCHCKLCSQCSV